LAVAVVRLETAQLQALEALRVRAVVVEYSVHQALVWPPHQ
jgi:hypothetical protein